MRRPRPGYVYILASKRNGTLYIGVTSDLPHRLETHRAGTVAGFAKQHGARILVHVEAYATIYEARVRERQLKKWNRAWKLRLIEEANPTWADRTADLMASGSGL